MQTVESTKTTPALQAKATEEKPFFAPAGRQTAGEKAFFGGSDAGGNGFFKPRPQPVVQAKLSIGQPGDKYEQEADRMAERVVSQPAVQRQELAEEEEKINRKPLAAEITPFVQRQPEEKEPETMQRKPAVEEPEEDLQRQTAQPEEEPPVQTKPEHGSSAAPTNLQSRLDTTKGGGNPLPAGTRSQMENAFGADFGSVRVHTGSDAAQLNKDLSAQAFTHGSDVYFNEGKYRPETTEGKRLLGHELVHVVQQGKLSRQINSYISRPAGNNLLQLKEEVHVNLRRPQSVKLFPKNDHNKVFQVSAGTETESLIRTAPYNIKKRANPTEKVGNWGLQYFALFHPPREIGFHSNLTYPKRKTLCETGLENYCNPKSDSELRFPHELIVDGTPHSHGCVRMHKPDAINLFNTVSDGTPVYVYSHSSFKGIRPTDTKEVAREDASTVEPTQLESPIIEGTRSVNEYSSSVAMHEDYLRNVYNASSKGISDTADELINKGLKPKYAARWANDARNSLKVKIRNAGNPILKKVFENRNLHKYKNKVGPSYKRLYRKYRKMGLSPEAINRKIIRSAGATNISVNRWSGRLRIGGRIMAAIDIALAGVRVYLAPEGEKTKTALEEVVRIGGALIFGALGANLGTAAGAAIGALFGVAGAFPGAIIGGTLGGMLGSLFGDWIGKMTIEKLYETLPPSDCALEGEFINEDKPI